MAWMKNMSPWSETPYGSWFVANGAFAVNVIRHDPGGGVCVRPESVMWAPRYGASGPRLSAKYLIETMSYGSSVGTGCSSTRASWTGSRTSGSPKLYNGGSLAVTGLTRPEPPFAAARRPG